MAKVTVFITDNQMVKSFNNDLLAAEGKIMQALDEAGIDFFDAVGSDHE